MSDRCHIKGDNLRAISFCGGSKTRPAADWHNIIAIVRLCELSILEWWGGGEIYKRYYNDIIVPI